jgi:hypothetical protein
MSVLYFDICLNYIQLLFVCLFNPYLFRLASYISNKYSINVVDPENVLKPNYTLFIIDNMKFSLRVSQAQNMRKTIYSTVYAEVKMIVLKRSIYVNNFTVSEVQ